jgi:hypothetical protein
MKLGSDRKFGSYYSFNISVVTWLGIKGMHAVHPPTELLGGSHIYWGSIFDIQFHVIETN